MATKEELLRQFMLDQKKVIKESEEKEQRKNSTSYKKQDEDGIKTINFFIGAKETVKEYKGYFVTDSENQYLRRIQGIRMTGCSYKAYKTVGLRTMDLTSYSDSLDQESKDLIIRFNNLWDRLVSYPEAAQKEATKIQDDDGTWINDPRYFAKKYHYDFFYMYITEGPGIEKPDYYLIQCKSEDFAVAKANMINKQVKMMKEFGADPTQFALEMFDNTTPKKRLVTIKFTRPNGYKFDIDTDPIDTEFTLPKEGLDKLVPLSEAYINSKSIDKKMFEDNINVVASWISKIESNNQKAAAVQTVEAKNDPFAD